MSLLHPPTKGDHYVSASTTQTRPLKYFRPTRAELHPSPSSWNLGALAPSRWSSRASRKSRYAPSAIHVTHHHSDPEKTVDAHKGRVLVHQRLRHPSTQLKMHLTWDVSFWVAIVFVLGSTAWIVNGFYLFLPLVNAGAEHANAAAWWAFVGGTMFELGSYLMVVEALNTGHEELFGPALWGSVKHPRSKDRTPSESSDGDNQEASGPSSDIRRFRWIGVGDWRELGFLASVVQMFAATIFWVSTITGLPGVIPGFPADGSTAIVDVFFWTPQVIGGSGFIVSSLLLMVEVQKRWWRPNLTSLGWHVGLWNLVGATGFMLCGALGYASLASTKVNYESVLATFWGSFAFLIGSVIQLWETLWREDPASGSARPSG